MKSFAFSLYSNNQKLQKILSVCTAAILMFSLSSLSSCGQTENTNTERYSAVADEEINLRVDNTNTDSNRSVTTNINIAESTSTTTSDVYDDPNSPKVDLVQPDEITPDTTDTVPPVSEDNPVPTPSVSPDVTEPTDPAVPAAPTDSDTTYEAQPTDPVPTTEADTITLYTTIIDGQEFTSTVAPQKTQPVTIPQTMTPDEMSFAQEVFQSYNDWRAARGLNRVVWSDTCANMAYQSAKGCAELGELKHRLGIPADSQHCYSDILQYASWRMTGQEAVNAWESSQGHRKMMQCTTATEAAVGAYFNNGIWWFAIVYDFSGTNVDGD